MMALGRALVAAPKMLMIDELSLGLAPVVMGDILGIVDEFTARGITLLVVEQSINMAASLTDHAYFLEKGEVRFSGPTTELLERGDIARSVFFGAPSCAASMLAVLGVDIPAQIVLLGVIAGLIYGLLGVGLALLYKSTRRHQLRPRRGRRATRRL